ncbi:hypothetical protein Q0M94_12850 [Deinococcus radiomollis]|uniref:hypothetical protein n=1 Tax=Deinococcus radiomollis TaxID=468916 RepID=UPI003891D41B
MNRLMALAGAAGMAAVLASCGSASTPDGSASLQATNLRTEYVDSVSGAFVACDNVFGAYTSTNRTAVAVNFTTSGSVQSADIGLRGATTSAYDGNYNTNTSNAGLYSLGNGSYQTTFYADSSQGFLPQSIIVAPRGIAIKAVRPTTQASGSFYASLRVYSSTGDSAATDTRFVKPNIIVYASCDYVGNTGSTL